MYSGTGVGRTCPLAIDDFVETQADQVERRVARHRERRGGREVDVVGERDRAVLGHGGVLRPAVPVGEADHPLALARAVRDDARDLLAGPEVLAHLHERQLATVDARRVDLDEQLVGARLGRGQLTELGPALTAGSGYDRLHQISG